MYLATLLGNFDCTTAFLGAFIFFVLLYYLKSGKPKNFPPGPRGLPLVGYVPFTGGNLAETMRKMKSKYGPVISVQMGMEDWVVLNDYDTINEALVKQGEIFSGRPSIYMFEITSGGYGIISTDYGPVWKNLRRFGLATLRGFGVGKKGMEKNVEEEMPYLLENLLIDDKESVSTKMGISVSNIICRVVFGYRFSYDDKKLLDLIRVMEEFGEETYDGRMFAIMCMAPVLRHFPPFCWAFGRIKANADFLVESLREIMEEHKTSFDKNDLRDFIDTFLKEMEQKGKNDPAFCEPQLLQYIRDLFAAGTGTTSSTLSWAILCFANYPEVQEKVATEVEHVLGGEGIPSMKHRDEMPYTCAFIQELMRHRTLLPMSLVHKTNKETTLCGYTIPKNTTISPNLWAVHMDPELFENPTEFRPERFLDNEGKFIKSKHVIPFSIGPRHCLGEQLARMEVFIFLTGIVQKLKVLPDPAQPLPHFNTTNYGFILLDPPRFTVKFEKR